MAGSASMPSPTRRMRSPRLSATTPRSGRRGSRMPGSRASDVLGPHPEVRAKRASKDGSTHRQNAWPSFETPACGRLLRMGSVCVAVLLALLALTSPALAKTYPEKPIRILVGFAAGGPADITGRLVGDRLSG